MKKIAMFVAAALCTVSMAAFAGPAANASHWSHGVAGSSHDQSGWNNGLQGSGRDQILWNNGVSGSGHHGVK